MDEVLAYFCMLPFLSLTFLVGKEVFVIVRLQREAALMQLAECAYNHEGFNANIHDVCPHCEQKPFWLSTPSRIKQRSVVY